MKLPEVVPSNDQMVLGVKIQNSNEPKVQNRTKYLIIPIYNQVNEEHVQLKDQQTHHKRIAKTSHFLDLLLNPNFTTQTIIVGIVILFPAPVFNEICKASKSCA